jgi:hypothetical protein
MFVIYSDLYSELQEATIFSLYVHKANTLIIEEEQKTSLGSLL